jgi:hypothetical protein
MMQPIMIGRKSLESPVVIDHFGHFMRAFLNRWR